MALWKMGAATAALMIASSAAAQTAPQPVPAPPPSDEVEGVVVSAPRMDAISAFVRSFSQPTTSGRLARWNKTVCARAAGLAPRYNEYLVTRVGEVARSVGLKVGEPGCNANVLIIVTSDPDRVLDYLASEHKDMFAVNAFSDDTVKAAGGETLAQFRASERPVRWWHVVETVPADGSIQSGNTVRVFSPSRLRSSMREDFTGAIVVVDARKAVGVSYTALADYITMGSLAQLDPDAQAADAPTVMNLFRPRSDRVAPIAGLTDWDRSYLKGLYKGSRGDEADLKRQRRRIIGGMRSGG